MDLIESLTDKSNVRGIALNSQNIDLFNIIEQAQSHEEAVQKICEYLDGILQANRTFSSIIKNIKRGGLWKNKNCMICAKLL